MLFWEGGSCINFTQIQIQKILNHSGWKLIISSLILRGPEKCCITGNTGQSERCGAQHQTLVDLKKEGYVVFTTYTVKTVGVEPIMLEKSLDYSLVWKDWATHRGQYFQGDNRIWMATFKRISMGTLVTWDFSLVNRCHRWPLKNHGAPYSPCLDSFNMVVSKQRREGRKETALGIHVTVRLPWLKFAKSSSGD